ncbi:MAG: hypothetical protein U1E53_24035 [Dongiaceae bacterium]
MTKSASGRSSPWGDVAQRNSAGPASRAAQQEVRARKEREAIRKADEVKRARLRELRQARDEVAATAAAAAALKAPKLAKG